MIRVGIIGGAGYTAGELIRLLLHHPEAEIAFVHSTSNAKNLLTDVHEGLLGETDMKFTSRLSLKSIDVLFLCMGHGKSAEFLAEHPVPQRVRIIDLAQDFRLASPDHDYIYGLPELNHEDIKAARHIANPGCFATAIQLGLLPLAANWLVHDDISVNAITGGTDAQGEVTVRLMDGGLAATGRGSDPDVIISSAKAYIDALNRIAAKEKD